jgi:rod shape-determining protein MreD
LTRHLSRLFLALAFCLLVQLAPGVSRWGFDIPLVFVALVGVQMPLLEAAVWGALAGLGQDLLSQCGLGPHMAAKMLAGMMAHFFHTIVYKERVAAQALLVTFCMLFQQLFLWMYFHSIGEAPLFPRAVELVARSTVLTGLAGVLASAWLVWRRRQYNDPATA